MQPVPAKSSHTSETLCVLPWVHLFVDEKGELFPCCMSRKEPFRNEKGKPIQVAHNGIDSVWNCSSTRQFRKEFLSGIKPDRCENCWKSESLGMKSFRQIANVSFSSVLEEILENTDREGYAPLEFRSIDLRLGNRCNLRCRMCFPDSSRLLAREYEQLFKDKYSASDSAFDWYRHEKVLSDIIRHSKNLTNLHIAGGEPLIIQEGFNLLSSLINQGIAKQIRLSYNTNLTVIPRNAPEIWNHFASTSLIVSLDGVGSVNSYIRFPSDWSSVIRNLRNLADQALKNPQLQISIHTTVQLYNILRLTDLFHFLKSIPGIDPFPRLDFVFRPPYLDCRLLPRYLKHLARNRIQTYLDSTPDLPKDFSENLQGILSYLETSATVRFQAEFIRVTRHMDRERGQDLLEVLPEFRTMFRSPLLNLGAWLSRLKKSFRPIYLQIKSATQGAISR